MNEELAKYIEQLEVELLNQDVRQSTEKISELLADDFFEFGMSGKKFTKKDILEILPKGSSKYKGMDFKAKLISPDTILLTYRASVTNAANKKILTLRSSLWQKRGDKWKMIFHQGTVQKNNNS